MSTFAPPSLAGRVLRHNTVIDYSIAKVFAVKHVRPGQGLARRHHVVTPPKPRAYTNASLRWPTHAPEGRADCRNGVPIRQVAER